MSIKNILKNTYIVTALIVAVFVGAILFNLMSTFQNAGAATGSRFVLQHEYLEAGGDALANAVLSTTTTSTATASTTSSVEMNAVSTTSIIILTAGVSDLRLNMLSHSTTTAEGGTVHDIIVKTRSNDGVEVYFDLGVISSTDRAIVDSSFQWTAATSSSEINLSPASDIFAAGSLQISNINSPFTIIDIGSNAAADLYIEIVKTVPN